MKTLLWTSLIPDTTGRIMQFRVVPTVGPDPTTPAQFLVLPAIARRPSASEDTALALVEMMSMYSGDGPAEAMLGTVDSDGNIEHKMWAAPVSENPNVGDTGAMGALQHNRRRLPDAHPRDRLRGCEPPDSATDEEEVVLPIELIGEPIGPEPWERGLKDTVIAYPGQVTRLRAKFNSPGQFVWHCHIVEHEDNEMMRPYRSAHPSPASPTETARSSWWTRSIRANEVSSGARQAIRLCLDASASTSRVRPLRPR